jgi:hypothetical protein
MLLLILDRLARRRHRQGSSGVWTGLAFAAFLVRQYQRRTAANAVVLREELRPGQTLVIEHFNEPRG